MGFVSGGNIADEEDVAAAGAEAAFAAAAAAAAPEVALEEAELLGETLSRYLRLSFK